MSTALHQLPGFHHHSLTNNYQIGCPWHS
jgi:hypothetical protein